MQLVQRAVVFVLVSSQLGFAQGGDQCGSAEAISGAGLFDYDTTGANDDFLTPSCGTVRRGVWFLWTAPATGAATITTCGLAGTDTNIAAWDGSTGCPVSIELACSDDSACGVESEMLFSVGAGSTYYLQIGLGPSGIEHAGQFEITVTPPPSNDNCSNPLGIVGLGDTPFDTLAASDDGPIVSCLGTKMSKDVWFEWLCPTTASYLFETCQSSFDSVIAIWDNSTGCPVTNELACNVYYCGSAAGVLFDAVAGTVYQIQVGGNGPFEYGSGFLNIGFDPCLGATDDCLEPNDDCSVARPIGNVTTNRLFVSKMKSDWYSLTVENLATLQVDAFFTHAVGDVDLALVDGCGGTVLASSTSTDDDESLTWTNMIGVALPIYLRVDVKPSSEGNCNNYDLVITGSQGLGDEYCPATVNSTGRSADIGAPPDREE